MINANIRDSGGGNVLGIIIFIVIIIVLISRRGGGRGGGGGMFNGSGVLPFLIGNMLGGMGRSGGGWSRAVEEEDSVVVEVVLEDSVAEVAAVAVPGAPGNPGSNNALG